MKLIVGLGNPGHTFHDTRHNTGFSVIQHLAERRHVRVDQPIANRQDGRPAAVFGDYTFEGQSIRLMMPLTMMNESGEALRDVSVPVQDILVVCDDVNLAMGAIRVRPEGGAGGHHGLQSCLEVLGTERLPRLRVGVASGPLPKELSEFVLTRFTSEEHPVIRQTVAQAAEAVETWAKEGIEVAMNRYNRTQEASR